MLSFPPKTALYTSVSTDPNQPSSASSSARIPTYRRSPLAFITGGLALIFLTAILVLAERRPSTTTSGSYDASSSSSTWLAALSPSSENAVKPSGPRKKVCDPHDLPGVLHIAEDIDSIQGALETVWQPIDPTSCPAQSYIQRIVSLSSSSNSSTSSPIPSSLYNRTILLIGDSIDRGNAQYTCHLLSGTHSTTHPGDKYWAQDDITIDPQSEGWKPNSYSDRSFPTICHIESIDLMIMNVFHFGLDQEEYFTWKDQYGPPYTTEERIDQIAKHLVEKVGRKIDILEFSSGLWDLARFGRQDDSLLTSDSTTTIRHLTLERLQWFSSRFSTILSHLQSTFPPSSIPQRYIRKLHTSSDDDAGSFQQWWQTGGGGKDGDKHTYYFPSWRINELNRAIENAIFKNNNLERKGNGVWELDNWGDKLAGMELFEKGNVHPHYAATTLWLEQMFYRFVNGPA